MIRRVHIQNFKSLRDVRIDLEAFTVFVGANGRKFAAWKDEMAPGELWSLFGEKWLADKEAVP